MYINLCLLLDENLHSLFKTILDDAGHWVDEIICCTIYFNIKCFNFDFSKYIFLSFEVILFNEQHNVINYVMTTCFTRLDMNKECNDDFHDNNANVH